MFRELEATSLNYFCHPKSDFDPKRVQAIAFPLGYCPSCNPGWICVPIQDGLRALAQLVEQNNGAA